MKLIAAYGLTQQQLTLLEKALPRDYTLLQAECVTDLIITDAVCVILAGQALSPYALRVLLCYYIEVDEMLCETVLWLDAPELPDSSSFLCYDSLEELLPRLSEVIALAQERYDLCTPFRYLPRHTLEESLEQDLYDAFFRTYGPMPDRKLVLELRRRWQRILENGGADRLAKAVHAGDLRPFNELLSALTPP